MYLDSFNIFCRLIFKLHDEYGHLVAECISPNNFVVTANLKGMVAVADPAHQRVTTSYHIARVPCTEPAPSARLGDSVPLCHLQTSILDLLINTRSSTQTIFPRFYIGLLHPKVLLVEVRLSCCLEPISRHGQ